MSHLAIRLASLGSVHHDVSLGDNAYPVEAYQRGVDLLPWSLEQSLARMSDKRLALVAFDPNDRRRTLIDQVQCCIVTGISDWLERS